MHMKTKPTAVITGASSGIGLAAAQVLQHTHNLVLVARSGVRLQESLKSLGGTSDFVVCPCDVSDAQGIERIIKSNRPEVIIHSAGTMSLGTLREDARNPAKVMMETHYLGTVHVVQAAFNYMEPGHLGVMSSFASLFPAPGGYSVYGAAKAALNSFCESVRRELLHKGITLTLGHFSYVQTAMKGAPVASVADERARMRSFKRFAAAHAGNVLVRDTLLGRKESHLCLRHRLLARIARTAPRTFGAIVRLMRGIR